MRIHPRHHVLENLLSRLVPETRLLLRHLLGCRRCRTAALVALEAPREAFEDDRVLAWPAHRDRLFPEDLVEKLERRREEYAREKALAPSLVAEVLGCLSEERRRRVLDHERFHSAAFVMRVLEEGRQRLADQPFDGLELIDLGRETAERIDASRYGQSVRRDLRARAWAYLGDAHRRCGDLPAAEEAFCKAEALLEDTGDPLEEARFLRLKAALLRDQRSFHDSRRLQRRAERELRRCQQADLG